MTAGEEFLAFVVGTWHASEKFVWMIQSADALVGLIALKNTIAFILVVVHSYKLGSGYAFRWLLCID